MTHPPAKPLKRKKLKALLPPEVDIELLCKVLGSEEQAVGGDASADQLAMALLRANTVEEMKLPVYSIARFVRCECTNCITIPNDLYVHFNSLSKVNQQRMAMLRRGFRMTIVYRPKKRKPPEERAKPLPTSKVMMLANTGQPRERSPRKPFSTRRSIIFEEGSDEDSDFDDYDVPGLRDPRPPVLPHMLVPPMDATRVASITPGPAVPPHLLCTRRMVDKSTRRGRRYRPRQAKADNFVTPLYRRMSMFGIENLLSPKSPHAPQSARGGLRGVAAIAQRAREKDQQGGLKLKKGSGGTPQMMNEFHLHNTSDRGSSDWTAEVVLIGSSMQMDMRAYMDGLRCRHLLDCKGVEYFYVDISLDDGDEFPDGTLIRRWNERRWLLRDRRKKSSLSVVVPQVLLDGVPLGGYLDLLALESDNDFDYMLAREACPNCFARRNPESVFAIWCSKCDVSWRHLMNEQFLSKPQLERLMNRNIYNVSTVKSPDVLEGAPLGKMYKKKLNKRLMTMRLESKNWDY